MCRNSSVITVKKVINIRVNFLAPELKFLSFLQVMSLRSDQREDGESTSGSSEAKTDRYGFLLVNGDLNNDRSVLPHTRTQSV